MKSGIGRLAILLAVAAVAVLLFSMGLHEALTFDNLKQRQGELAALVAERPFLAVCAYFLLYVAMTAASFPGARILSLGAGGLFELWLALLLVSGASTIGACVALLAARYLFRDAVRRKYAARIEAIDRGIERDGALYLLALRLNPVVPYFLVNIAMGLTALRLARFALVSLVGMLPATIIYVNAGTQLARLEGIGDILSLRLLGSLLLLSLLPLLARFAVDRMRRA